MCLQCAMWLCTPESTETQTQKNTHTYILYMHVETQKNTQVLTKQARSPCSELLSRWPWSRMMPLQSTKTQNRELTSDFYVTTSKQFPLVLTLQRQNNDTKTYHCIYHPATWNLDWSDLWDQTYLTPFIIRWGRARGGRCPKLFVLLLFSWAKNMPDLAIKNGSWHTQHTQFYKNNQNFS